MLSWIFQVWKFPFLGFLIIFLLVHYKLGLNWQISIFWESDNFILTNILFLNLLFINLTVWDLVASMLLGFMQKISELKICTAFYDNRSEGIKWSQIFWGGRVKSCWSFWFPNSYINSFLNFRTQFKFLFISKSLDFWRDFWVIYSTSFSCAYSSRLIFFFLFLLFSASLNCNSNLVQARITRFKICVQKLFIFHWLCRTTS